MRIFITGIAGVLGSTLARTFLKDHSIVGNDIIRPDEAWRLADIKDGIGYLWRSSRDLKREDLEPADVVIDTAIGYPDRPFGIDNPFETLHGNIDPQLSLLEILRHIDQPPAVIYPSSFNVLYGYCHNKVVFTERMQPFPTSLYGVTKAMGEMLYQAYNMSYGIPVVIVRVGSGYGPMMRSDELPARLIINTILNRDIHLRSPTATRLWTHADDIVSFYKCLLRDDGYNMKWYAKGGMVFHSAGNLGDQIVSNEKLASMIVSMNPYYEGNITNGDFEPGETLYGTPIKFGIDSEMTRHELGWEPKVSLEEGIHRTYNWFVENIHRYSPMTVKP